MTTAIDRLNEARKAASDECMLLGAVAGTLDALHDELQEQKGREDAIIDAVMDALARVRPGWVRTKREWEAPRITTYVDARDAEQRLDEARAEVELLRAEVASLRGVDDDGDGAPDTDETDDGWEPGPWWSVGSYGLSLKGDGTSYAHVEIPHWMLESNPDPWRANVSPMPGEHQGESAWFASMADGARWCERHPHMSHFFASWQGAQQTEAAYTSAPTVGATDAGPDAPALIVEGDGDTGALQESAVPAAPVSGAEQSCGETGVDRPRDDERIVGPREGEDVTSRNPPYGYDVDDSGAVPVLRTVQSEAAVMLRICEMLDEHRNATEIAATLNDEGHRSRTGTMWTPSSVRARILGSVDEWREVGR